MYAIAHLVGDGELSKIVTNHLWLDFDLGEDLAVVHSNDRSSHLWNHDHVSQMGLDNIGLLVDGAFLLLLAELLDQSHGLTLESSGELAPDSAGEQLHQTLVVHVQKLVKIHTTVGELPEGPLLPQLCSLISHDYYKLSAMSK